jgi:hypothetical protein
MSRNETDIFFSFEERKTGQAFETSFSSLFGNILHQAGKKSRFANREKYL